MLACQSSLSPKVFGQTALQNCILPLFLPARVQTVPAPFCVQDLRAVAAQPASTAGHLPCLGSHATDGLEILQSMRDKAPMPHLQHSISWEELLPQLRHSLEVVETRHVWPAPCNG